MRPPSSGNWGPGVDRWSQYVHPYSDSGLPAPGDGPSVVRLIHRGNAHEGRRPTDCEQCGREVAAELRRLNVGTGGEFIIYIYHNDDDLEISTL